MAHHFIVVVDIFPHGHFTPQKVNKRNGEGAGGEEGVAVDAELASEVVGPPQEHVGDYGHRRRGVVAEPVGDGVAEPGQGAHHGDEAAGGEVDGVLDAGGDGGVRRKREDERGDGLGVGGEEGVQEREVFGGYENGYGEAARGEVAREIQEWYHVPLRRIGEYQDVCAGFRHLCRLERERERVEILVIASKVLSGFYSWTKTRSRLF